MLVLVLAACSLSCGGKTAAPAANLMCGGCDCVAAYGGHRYELSFPPPPSMYACTEDGRTRTFANTGICEDPDAVSEVGAFWTDVCGFP